MTTIRAALIGAGAFGRNHARVISQLPGVELAAIVDVNLEAAQQLAQQYGSRAFTSAKDVLNSIDASIVATPTVTHEQVATELLESGIDVLIEKPIAESSAAGERLSKLAEKRGRVLQVGHLERFNPAVVALENALTIPLFFEVHRLSVFTPRSLDIDVILDLMIHDLDIVLSFTREMPNEIRAAGISVLSKRVDIANVRLSFASGCIANLTASRVSTEQVRKLRLFQPGEYISLDYGRQEAVRLALCETNPAHPTADPGFYQTNSPLSSFFQIGFNPLAVQRGEPLALELTAFFRAVRDRSEPRINGLQATNALRVAEAILAKIKEHADLVARTISQRS